MKFIQQYIQEVKEICSVINLENIEKTIQIIYNVRKNHGRIFFIGVGGSAGNCSHAVNDFRKLADIECYTPTDNVSELTARINDDGWSSAFSNWLKISKISSKDLIFFLSVGGGNLKKQVSVNLIEAAKLAKLRKTKIISILGKKDGYLAKNSTSCIIIPTVNKRHITPHSESFQSILWHLIISHPKIKLHKTKW